MPFGIPWTDGIQEPGALERFLSFFWTARGTIAAEKWSLPFAVVSDGAAVGIQDLLAEDFAHARSVSSGSWLTMSAQGRGLGVEMRAARVDDAKSCAVDLTFDPPWSADRMTEDAKWELGMI